MSYSWDVRGRIWFPDVEEPVRRPYDLSRGAVPPEEGWSAAMRNLTQMKPAFSTVACPDWTLDRVAAAAERWGFLGVEMRTFGFGSTDFACDPALTSAAKTSRMFRDAGVEPVALATSIRYDDPITPPVIGNVISDLERDLRQTKGAIDLAVQIECPYVRVFGFEAVNDERRGVLVKRIAARLKDCCAYARNSGVKLLLENGGSFRRASEVSEILDAVDSPLLLAAYSIPVARSAGEDPANGINVLGDRVVSVKVKDFKGQKPCALGEGDQRVRDDIDEIGAAGFGGWVVFEYDRAWFPGCEDADPVLERSARRMFEWIGAQSNRGDRATARV